MKRHAFSALSSAVAFFLTLLCIIPFIYIFIKGLYTAAGDFTLGNYYEAYLAHPVYLYRFWRSMALCLCIAAGQAVVSVLGGYGFAKRHFPGKNIMFFLLMILMIMPFQVTLVPDYLILDELGLINTCYSLALPFLFVPLGTFIMTQSFRAVSDDIIDAARLDGCGTWRVLCKIAIPLAKGGLICATLLSFLDGWNMVEQPIAFLSDYEDFPLSLALASSSTKDSPVLLVCCILAALPPLLAFAFFNRELVEGIASGGEK